MSTNMWSVLVILICLWACPVRIHGFSRNISSSSSAATSVKRAPTVTMEPDGAVAEFALDGANDPGELKLTENARNKIAGPRNCWQEAYRKLFASCGEIMADKERQSRLSWHLSSCFQEDSGRPPFPSCAEGSKMVQCRKRMSESEGKVFLEFFLETDTLCRLLQVEAFKRKTERLINELIRASNSAEEKLEVIEERSDRIIKEGVQDTLSSVEMQADYLTDASKHVGEQINKSLENQMLLLNGQTQAMDGLNKLHSFQAQVLEESRDYEVVLNDGMLQTLVEKVRALAENAGGRALPYASEEEQSLREYSWVFDDLTDEAEPQDGPNIPPAARAVASNAKAAQPSCPGGGNRRELHHDVGLWPQK